MPQIYPDDGLLLNLLNVVENGGNGLAWVLWTNDIEPDLDSVFADFVLADPIWGKKLLFAADFDSTLVNLHVGTIQAPTQHYTNTTGATVNVYGYLAYDPIGNAVILVNRYDDAPLVVIAGGVLDLVPLVGDSSLVLTDIIDGGTF